MMVTELPGEHVSRVMPGFGCQGRGPKGSERQTYSVVVHRGGGMSWGCRVGEAASPAAEPGATTVRLVSIGRDWRVCGGHLGA